MNQDLDIKNKNQKALLYALISTFCIALIYFIFISDSAYRFGGVKEQVSEISDYFKTPSDDIKIGIDKSRDLIEKTKFNNNQ